MNKKSIVSKAKGSLVKEIDAAIALLTRARALALQMEQTPRPRNKCLPKRRPSAYLAPMLGKPSPLHSGSAGQKSGAKETAERAALAK